MLSARLLQSAIWPNAVAVAALLPLLLFGIFRIGAGRRRSGVIVAALTGGLCLLAARPHVIVGAAPLLLASGTTALALSRRKAVALGDLALAAFLAAALGAPSTVPAAILLPETSRSSGIDRPTRDLFALAEGGNLDQVFLPVDGPRRWPEAAAYPGFLVALLAVAGVFLALRRRSFFPRGLFSGLLAGGAIGLLFAFGERGPLALVADFPLLKGFRIPARYLTSWALALALASGLALAALLRQTRRPGLLASVALLGLAGDLVVHARGAAPTAPSAIYSIEPTIATSVARARETDEAGFPRRAWSLVPPPLLWFFSDAEKLNLAQRAEPLYGAIGMTFGLEMVGGSGPSPARWKSLFAGVDERRAELAGAGALVLPAPGGKPGVPSFDVRRFNGLPRAIVVPKAVVLRRSDSGAAVLDARFDPRRTVVLEEGASVSHDTRWTRSAGSVRLVERGPGRLTLDATLPGDGVLVVFDTFEKGWRARVDGGRPQPVLAADAAFQGVRLSSGRHVVELRYRPPGLGAGIAVAAVGVLGIAIVAFRFAR